MARSDQIEPSVDSTPPRVYCDFNDRLGPSTFGLSVLGTIADLQRQRIELTEGLRLILYDYDGFEDGEPAWIAAEGVVATHSTRGFVAEVDRESFRWIRRRSDPDSDLRSLARFRVEVVFEITGRGGVLAGSILQGALRTGQAAAVRAPSGSTVYLEIGAVEFLDYVAKLADPARMAMLWSLADGRPRPAGELAKQARVGASTASEHLARLLAGNLVTVERHGRHRYYRIAGAHVVTALEAIGALAGPAPQRDYRTVAAARSLRHARSCFDYLAGALGVEVTRALVSRRVLRLEDEQYSVTADGETLLVGQLGVDVGGARASRRQFAKACLDWTEREYHVAGALGAELLQRLLALAWLDRTDGSRGLRVTSPGLRGFRDVLGIDALASRYG